MNRIALVAVCLVSGLALQGCPIFPDDPGGCVSDSQCRNGLTCDRDMGICVRPGQSRMCDAPSDCALGEVCGSDARCHLGSCKLNGCVTGYECRGVSGQWVCQPGDVGVGGSAGTSGVGGGSAGTIGTGGTGAAGEGGEGGVAGESGVAGEGGEAGALIE